MSNEHPTKSNESIDAAKESQIKTRIGKFAAYLLRYGALREEIKVEPGGFIKLEDLILHPYFKTDFYRRLLMEELNSSLSHRKTNRFEIKEIEGIKYVRATYGRKFKPSKYHDETKVKKLLETCLDFVVKNIESYSFEGFPDEYLINEMIHRMKRNKKLNTSHLESLLCAGLERLDLQDTYLSERILKIICKKCTSLRYLSFKDCGCFINDSNLEMVLKNCRYIENLELTFCSYLTDRSLKNIIKYLSNSITSLNISRNSNYTEDQIIDLVQKCENLIYLDLYHVSGMTSNGSELIKAISLSRQKHQKFEVMS